MKHTVHQMTKDTNGRIINRCVAKFVNESDAKFFLRYKLNNNIPRGYGLDHRVTYEKREVD